jgi:hypothetical protein
MPCAAAHTTAIALIFASASGRYAHNLLCTWPRSSPRTPVHETAHPYLAPLHSVARNRHCSNAASHWTAAYLTTTVPTCRFTLPHTATIAQTCFAACAVAHTTITTPTGYFTSDSWVRAASPCASQYTTIIAQIARCAALYRTDAHTTAIWHPAHVAHHHLCTEVP